MNILDDLPVDSKLELAPHAWIQRRNDGFYNERNVRVVQTPGAIAPKIERELFHPDIHKKIVEFIKSEGYLLEEDYNEFHRVGAHNIPFMKYIHKQLAEVASEIFGEKVIPSYCYTSLYNERGVCPFHTDRPQCKYTIDYCIDQDEIWPIFVDGIPYILNPNDALCYSGTDSPHFRKQITGKYCWLVFFHFVPESFNSTLD